MMPKIFHGYTVFPNGVVTKKSGKGELRYSYNKHGYVFVGLRVGNRVVRKSIHRLVAELFIPNPDQSIPKRKIGDTCRGVRKSTRGYIFKFKDQTRKTP